MQRTELDVRVRMAHQVHHPDLDAGVIHVSTGRQEKKRGRRCESALPSSEEILEACFWTDLLADSLAVTILPRSLHPTASVVGSLLSWMSLIKVFSCAALSSSSFGVLSRQKSSSSCSGLSQVNCPDASSER